MKRTVFTGLSSDESLRQEVVLQIGPACQTEEVRPKADMPKLGVSAGAVGLVSAFYDGDGYEVEFRYNKGQDFSTITLEGQIEKLTQQL